MSEKVLIYVLGMGRSGTSALTRVLSLCGGALPVRLLPESEVNPRGFWEPLDALEMNDQFLQVHGSSWFDPTLRIQQEIAFDPDRAEAFIDQLRQFLAQCPTGPALIVKEPRITALTRFWFEAARREEFVIRAVISVRHPQEVARSWVAAAISEPLSHTLWLKYNLLAERSSRGLPRIFVDYANLLRDWQREASRIARSLDVDLAIDSNTAKQVDEFLTQDLYRQRCDRQVYETFGNSWISRVYGIVSGAAQDQPLDQLVLDEIYEAYSAAERAFRFSIVGSEPTWRIAASDPSGEQKGVTEIVGSAGAAAATK